MKAPDAFIGRNEKGVEQYGRVGKQFREMPEFFQDGIYSMADKLAAKSSYPIRPFLTKGSSALANSSDNLNIKRKYGWKGDDSYAQMYGKNILPFASKRGFVKSAKDAFTGTPSTQHTNFYAAKDEAKAKIIRGELNSDTTDFVRRIKQNNLQKLDKHVVGEGIVSKAAEELIREYQGNPDNIQKIVNQLRDYGVPEWKIKYTLEYGSMTEEEAQKSKNERRAKHKK